MSNATCGMNAAIKTRMSLRSSGLRLLSGRNGRQFKYASVLCCFGDFTRAQGQPDRIELFRVLQRKIWRPSRVILDEFDRDFSRIATLMNELYRFSDHF